MRFACGTRVGSPAAVKSPRTGSAMIWAACLPTAHSSVPDGLRTSAARPGRRGRRGRRVPLPLVPAADDGRLRNQSEAAAAAEPVRRRCATAAGDRLPRAVTGMLGHDDVAPVVRGLGLRDRAGGQARPFPGPGSLPARRTSATAGRTGWLPAR